MRMTASWSGSNDPTAYKSVARRCAPMASSPRILNQTDRQAPTRPPSYAKARLAVRSANLIAGDGTWRNRRVGCVSGEPVTSAVSNATRRNPWISSAIMSASTFRSRRPPSASSTMPAPSLAREVLFRPRHDHRHRAPTCARCGAGRSGDRAALQRAHAQPTPTRRARCLHGCPARQSCAQPSDQQNRRE